MDASHEARVCSYRAYNGIFSEPQFKEAVQTCRKNISYYGVSYQHKNAIFERMINKLTLVSWDLLLHVTRLWPEAVSTMMWHFSFKAACQRYKSLEMDEDGKTPEHTFSGVDFQNFLT